MRPAIAVWVAVVVGCNGGGAAMPDSIDVVEIDAPQGPIDYAIAVDPPSLTLPMAGSGSVAITITRTNHTATITLGAVDVPFGVTVAFDPPTLAAGIDTSVATITDTGAVAGGAATITITAAADALERSATVDLAWGRITVAGKLRAGNSGVTVGIVGKPSVTTGSGGTFTFDDVPLPYDLYTVSNTAITNGIKTVHYYEGLTRPDPIVSSERPFFSTNVSSAALNGLLSGGNGASNRWVGWGDIGGSTTNVTTASYGTIIAGWPAATTKAGFVHAMMWTTKGSGGPDQIVYGSTAATLMAGNSYTVANGGNIDIALSPPTIATITGTLSPPATFPAPDVTLTQHFGGNSLFLYKSTENGELDANIPVIAAGKANVYAVSRIGEDSSFMAHPAIDASTDVSFTLPAPPALATPAPSASGVNLSTDFTWTGLPATVHVVTISTTETEKVSYVIYTNTTSVRIPDVAEAPLPSLRTYSWSVSGFGPHTSVNEVATEAGTRLPSPTSTEGPRHTWTVAASRSFTSQ